MSQLSIKLLGPFQAILNGKAITGFDSDKVRALLAYLAVEADQPHRREKLAGLLWPDFPERSARTSLRRALTNLRQVLSDQTADPPFLLVTRQTIQFNRASDHDLDVSAFKAYIEGEAGHPPEITHLEKAIALYRASFLDGFSIPDSSAFEEWALVTRETLQGQALRALHQLAGYYQEKGAYDQALQFAQRQLALDPYQEAAHQQVMWTLALTGQRNEALTHYETYRQLLESDLGVAPLEPTQAMYAQLLDGEIPVPPVTTVILKREARSVGECPYRGLAAFRKQDAPFFFGREEFTLRLTEAVRQRSMVAVIVGASGAGKSSTVFAGLLPRLQEQGTWLNLQCRPRGQPFHSLAAALLPILEPKLSETDQLIETQKLAAALSKGELPLQQVAERILEKHLSAERMLLIIDQFEELYTLCAQPALRRQYLDMLLTTTEIGAQQRVSPIVILLTLRADFMGQALTHRPFADVIQEGSLILGPMNRDELRQAIEKPAEKQGAAFETGLVGRILDDVGEEPGNLPLLEFALTLLWDRLNQGWVTHAAYEEIGQVDGALARYAEEVYAALDPEGQNLARGIFIQLMQPGEGTEDTRRVATREELGEGNWQLIQHLADKRLVVTGRDDSGEGTVEVVHEALLRGWHRLRIWMDADRTFRIWQESLRAAMRGWIASGKDAGALLRGVPLSQAETWLRERGNDLSKAEIAYIQASISLRERERARRERRRRRTIMGLATGLVIALILALFAGQQWRRADSASELALAREATAIIAQGQAIFEAATAVAAQEEAQHQTEIALTAQAEEASQRALAEAAEAQAVLERKLTEEQRRIAMARELSMAAISNLDVNPELSILLALQAVDQTYREKGTVLPEAEDALHKAVQASRVLLTLPNGSGVAFSPDGKWLIKTTGPETTAHLWESSSGELLVSISGHSDELMNVAFSPNGEHVATTSTDATAKIWNAENGELLQTLSGHTASLVSPAFSPDGTLLATTSMDGTARVWDVQTGEELHMLPHNGLTGGLAFSPDGSRLAIADHDAYAVKVWDTTTWQEVVTLTGHTEGVNDVVFNHDGSRLATASSDVTARVWDAESGEELLTLDGHNGFVFGIEFSPDGTQIATGSVDATAKIWDATTGRELLTLAGHATGISQVAFSPDGKRLATGSEEGVKIWDITPQGSREWLTLAGHTEPAFRLDYNPDGSLLATSGFDGTTRVWDISSGEELLTLAGHNHIVYDAKFNFDGSLLVTSSYDGTAILWDVATGQMLHRIEGQCGSIASIALSPDGSHLLTACEDGTAKLWDMLTYESLLTLDGHERKLHSDVFGVAFSPDGVYLATAGWDWTAKVWVAATGQELLTLGGHSNQVNHVVFSPDGGYLATASWDGTAKIWEIPSGREIRTLSGHSGIVWAVAFSPDGSQLATSSFDTTAKLWDFATGQELLTLTGHQIGLGGLTFSPDGRHLAVGGGDGTVRIYVLPIDELIALARERVTRWFTPKECQKYLHLEQCPQAP